MSTSTTHERIVKPRSGWPMLGLAALLLILAIASMTTSVLWGTSDAPFVPTFILFFILFTILTFVLIGFYTLQPNEARVLVLFGTYKGTVVEPGFHWGNPFYTNGSIAGTQESSDEEAVAKAVKSGKAPRALAKERGRYKISTRQHTLNGEKIKVNDKLGNPIEIGSVIVWHVADTAKATFDVENYVEYVQMQSETALRHVANLYAYDTLESDNPETITLRADIEEVSTSLKQELTERLQVAGISIDDARLSHLAYAPEIAQAMLRRQQADAIIAAREKIVAGAVGMVEMALNELAAKEIVELDSERKAAMVSNLMVVLCGESEVNPIINAGTLYH